MTRGKKELNNAVRASIVLEKAQWDHVRRMAMKMSVEQDRLITPTELLRLAINNYFPRLEQQDLFEDKVKVG